MTGILMERGNLDLEIHLQGRGPRRRQPEREDRRQAPPPSEGASPAHPGQRGPSLQDCEVIDFCCSRPACGAVFMALANEYTGSAG